VYDYISLHTVSCVNFFTVSLPFFSPQSTEYHYDRRIDRRKGLCLTSLCEHTSRRPSKEMSSSSSVNIVSRFTTWQRQPRLVLCVQSDSTSKTRRYWMTLDNRCNTISRKCQWRLLQRINPLSNQPTMTGHGQHMRSPRSSSRSSYIQCIGLIY